MASDTRLIGGSPLGDFLSGATSGFSLGEDIVARRRQDRLAEERERRAREYQAAQETRQQEQDALARAERALRGILPSDAPGIDRSARVAVGQGADATFGVEPLKGDGPESVQQVRGGDLLEGRYRDTGSGFVIDRELADPRVAGYREQRAAEDRDARASRALAGFLGPEAGVEPLIGAGVSPEAVARLGQQRATEHRELHALQTIAPRYGVEGADTLDAPTLRAEVDSRRGLAEREQELKLAARYRPPTYQYLRDPETGTVTAVNSSNPNDRRTVVEGQQLDPSSPTLGFPPTSYLKSTISERQAVARGNRAASALRYLQGVPMPGGLQAVIARSRGKPAETIRGGIESWLKNEASSAEGQRYANSLLAAAEPTLRDATGAVINEDELPRILSIISPEPGATKEVRADVFRQQDDVLSGFIINGGRAVTSPTATALRREAQELLDPRAYVKRRKRQFLSAGYDDDEANRLAVEDTKARFPNRGTN